MKKRKNTNVNTSALKELEKKLIGMPRRYFEEAKIIENRWVGDAVNPYIEESKRWERDVFGIR